MTGWGCSAGAVTGETTAATGKTTGATAAMPGKTVAAAGPDCSGEHELDDQTGRVPVGIHLRSADQSLAGITANGSAEAVYLVNFTDAHDAKLFPRGPLRTAFPRRRPSPVGFIWSLTAYTAQDKNLEV